MKNPLHFKRLGRNAQIRKPTVSAVKQKVLTKEEALASTSLESLSAEDRTEYDRIQTQIDVCQERLERLKKGRLENYKARNHRYVLDLEIPFQVFDQNSSPVLYENSFTVKKDTKFFATYLECSTYAVGTPVSGNTQLVLNLRPYLRPQYIQFEWAARDTGSDRAWQNSYLPMGLLKTNRVNSLDLSVPSVLSGGSELFFQVRVDKMSYPENDNLFESINRIIVQVSFAGYEVSEK